MPLYEVNSTEIGTQGLKILLTNGTLLSVRSEGGTSFEMIHASKYM